MEWVWICDMDHVGPMGKDRNDANAPEWETFKDDRRVHFRWSVGGDDKHNSSSKILERWNS